MLTITRDQILEDLSTLRNYCKVYFRHPLEQIKTPPTIHWQSAVIATFLINIVYGTLRAIFNFNLVNLLLGLFITPIMAAGILLLVTLFLFYFVQFALQKTFPFAKIATLLFIAYLPGSLFFLGSVAYPPLFLLGMVLMSALLIVGLIENLEIPRKTVLTLVGTGFLLALVFWILDQVYGYRDPMAPKSLDELEHEMDVTR